MNLGFLIGFISFAIENKIHRVLSGYFLNRKLKNIFQYLNRRVFFSFIILSL